MFKFKIRPSTAAIAISLCLIGTDAFAINGLLFYGLGARNRAMGGAGAAAALDTSTILINPAGLSDIGTSADLGVHALRAQRDLDTSDAVNGAVVNKAAGKQKSKQEVYLTPFSGISYKPENSKWAFGGIIAGVAGEGAKYRNSRTVPGQAGGYDTSSFLFIIKGIPAVSYDVNDKLTVGAALHINIAMFSTDLATATLAQTAGDGKLEIAYGYGAQVGATYDINSTWSVGGSYTTRQIFENFGDYKDLIPNFRLPPEMRLGFAYHATDKLLLTTDYKWIGWEEIELFGNKPTEGGFGWRDQNTFGIGLQYTANSKWIGRAGYNYGKSPIRQDSAFANALVPTVYEKHLSLGGEYRLNKNNSIALSVVRTFPNSVKDNGSGDLFSQLGQGTEISYEGWDADVQWTVNF